MKQILKALLKTILAIIAITLFLFLHSKFIYIMAIIDIIVTVILMFLAFYFYDN